MALQQHSHTHNAARQHSELSYKTTRSTVAAFSVIHKIQRALVRIRQQTWYNIIQHRASSMVKQKTTWSRLSHHSYQHFIITVHAFYTNVHSTAVTPHTLGLFSVHGLFTSIKVHQSKRLLVSAMDTVKVTTMSSLGMRQSQLKSASVGCGFYRSKSVGCGFGFVGARSKYNLIP